MTLMNLIRPKWKHSDPETRLKSLAELNNEDIEIIRELAESDPDSRVRIASISKIEDEPFLEQLLSGNPDAPVAEALRERLNRLYFNRLSSSERTDDRIQWLAKIDRQELLARSACESDDPEIRYLAAQRIQSPEFLSQIASSNCGLKTGLAIVDRISDISILQQIAETASNKKVKRIAQHKIDAILGQIPSSSILESVSAEETEEEETVVSDAQASDLVAALETLSVSSDFKRMRTSVDEARQKWAKMGLPLEHPLHQRFENAVNRVEQQVQQIEKQTQKKQELQRILNQAEQTASIPSDHAKEQMDELRRQWQDADRTGLPESDIQPLETRAFAVWERFDSAWKDLKQAEEKHNRRMSFLSDLCRQAENLLAGDPGGIRKRLWEEIEKKWPESEQGNPETQELNMRFDAALNGCRDRLKTLEEDDMQDKIAQENRLRELLNTVKNAVTAEDRSGLEQVVRSAQQEWKTIGGREVELKNELAPAFQTACDEFFTRQRELREQAEWERWANLNRKTELCEIAERINAESRTGGIPQILRDLRKQWRGIGPVAREKSDEIWHRFNTACDQAWERCKEKKNALYEAVCQQIESLEKMEKEPTPAQWTQTADAVKAIQSEWNAIGLLPQDMEKNLRNDFQKICDGFFKKLKEFYRKRDVDRQENLKRKREICEEAEKLSTSLEWSPTAPRLRDLQKLWREIGPTPKDQGDVLWERFQTACNGFFDRMKQQEPDNIQKKEKLCERVEALTANAQADADLDKISREIIEIQKEWKTIGPVPNEQGDALWKRFHNQCDLFFVRFKDYLKQKEDHFVQNRAAKEDLAAKAEALSHSNEWRETGDRLKEIQQQWKSIGSAGREADGELWNRFRSACDIFFKARSEHYETMDRKRLENLKRKEQLCLLLETVARLVAPDQAPQGLSPAAEQLSLALALDLKSEIVVSGNPKLTWDRALKKAKDAQKNWKEIGPAPHDQEQAIWNRFRTVSDFLFSNRTEEGSREGSRNSSEGGAGSKAS